MQVNSPGALLRLEYVTAPTSPPDSHRTIVASDIWAEAVHCYFPPMFQLYLANFQYSGGDVADPFYFYHNATTNLREFRLWPRPGHPLDALRLIRFYFGAAHRISIHRYTIYGIHGNAFVPESDYLHSPHDARQRNEEWLSSFREIIAELDPGCYQITPSTYAADVTSVTTTSSLFVYSLATLEGAVTGVDSSTFELKNELWFLPGLRTYAQIDHTSAGYRGTATATNLADWTNQRFFLKSFCYPTSATAASTIGSVPGFSGHVYDVCVYRHHGNMGSAYVSLVPDDDYSFDISSLTGATREFDIQAETGSRTILPNHHLAIVHDDSAIYTAERRVDFRFSTPSYHVANYPAAITYNSTLEDFYGFSGPGDWGGVHDVFAATQSAVSSVLQSLVTLANSGADNPRCHWLGQYAYTTAIDPITTAIRSHFGWTA